MNRFYNKYCCRTCSAWDQAYPVNPELGDCVRLPLVIFDGNIVALGQASDWRDNPEPPRDIETLRTAANFGCTSYTHKQKALTNE